MKLKKLLPNSYSKKITNKSVASFSYTYESSITKALKEKYFASLKKEFNKILNEFSYESIHYFKEYAFRDIYKVILQIIGYNTYTEYQTSMGRSDLCFEDDQHLYICEFKVIGRSDSVKNKLEEAKQQIKEKRYCLRLTDKEVIALAVVIINENKEDGHAPIREVAAIEEAL